MATEHEMSVKDGFGSTAGNLFDVGVKAADMTQKLAEVSVEASRKAMHSNVSLGAAFVEFASEQLRSLGAISAPATFLQRQREAGETLNGKLGGYVESLRSIGVEAQAGYGAVAKELFAAWGAKAA